MKKLLSAIFCIFSIISAQTDERDTLFTSSDETDTLFAKVPTPVLSVGISGGTTFINPEHINSQIEFNNSVFDASERPIRTPLQLAAWLAFRPVNFPNYLSLRGEIITASRSFSFSTEGTNNSGGAASPVTGTATLNYSVYPISFNTGAVLPKTRVKLEIGFVYAIAMFTDETQLDQGGTFENTYEGSGYGFRVMAQQVLPINRSFSLTLDFAYRYLVIEDFRDPRGRSITNFQANYNGINLMVGMSYGL